MREWNSYSDDLTIDGNVVKEYTIRFKTTEYEVYKRIENFFQRLMDEPHTMDKCYKCRWWNYAYGCQNKKGICQFEAMADRKTEPSRSEKPNNCDTCRHKGVEGCEQPCLGCGCCGLYEAMTGNDKLKEKVVEFIKSCARCKHRPIGAMMCEESCHYEPKTETQTETQNSNLTFEKRTMRDCYNCKRYETEGECIECHYEPKDKPQTERSE